MTLAAVDMKWMPRTSGVMPEEARRYVIRFLQDFFSKSTGDFVWDPDPLRTSVYIGGPEMNIETANPRPLIVVTFNGAQWMGVFKDQYVQGVYDRDRNDNPFLAPDGKAILGQLYSDTLRGSISCICRARETNAVLLASKAFLALTIYKEVARHMGLYDLTLPRISKEMSIKADVKEVNTEVRVDFEFMTNVAWILTPTLLDEWGKSGDLVPEDPKLPKITDCEQLNVDGV